jgi:inner membrane protein
MFIAHLPAGYLLTRGLQIRSSCFVKLDRKKLMIVGLIGSVFPDFDIFYLYFFSSHPKHHHLYWTHLPVYWLLILTILFLVKNWRADLFGYGIIFVANVFLHLILDTVAGDIWWLYPIVDQPFCLVTVPALYHPWWLNFVWHWTFGLEVSICIVVVTVWIKTKKP